MTRKLIYDVACSLDGFIDRGNGDVRGFLAEGDHVAAYFERLKSYDTVVMGRATYTFGYEWGMKPGDKPYPHMTTYVFSKSLDLPGEGVQVVREDAATFVRRLKGTPGGAIYLCGGGDFAATMLTAQLIDRVIVKMNPILLGAGTRLFANAPPAMTQLHLASERRHASGVVLLEYDLNAT